MRTSWLLSSNEEQANEMRNILWTKYPKLTSKSFDKKHFQPIPHPSNKELKMNKVK